MNKLDKDYQNLLQDILDNGVNKQDRTGTGTISVFGRQIRHKMSDGFPLLTTKKMAFKTMVTELLWFLRGDTNIKYLLQNGCHIWTGDAKKRYDENYKKYWGEKEGRTPKFQPISNKEFEKRILEDDGFAKEWGELGSIYGKQWRRWSVRPNQYGEYETNPIDQIQNLINELKNNPDSRRLMVNAWNPSDLPHQVLPPCHYGFQVYTRELSVNERLDLAAKTYDVFDIFDFGIPAKVDHNEIDKLYPVPKRAISLMYNARSQDVPLGTPFNIASYGLLLEIIGRMVNMVPDELITNLGDAHIYKNQIDGVKEQMTRTPMKLPTLIISDEINFNGTIDEFLESCNKDSFKLDGYESHPSIKMPLSN